MLKNITLSAEERVIEAARAKAQQEKTTLNSAFRSWLSRYAGGTGSASRYRALMRDLKHVSAGRKFSRQEMNER
jgi:hypothetical protein